MHAYPLYGILNIFFCPKTGVFRVFAMLGTPKPMEEIAPRHHKMFFLCLRHKNPSEKKIQKNSRQKSVTTDVQTYRRTPQQELRLRAMPPEWGVWCPGRRPWPAFFSKDVNKKLRYL